jgi:hypothetical protein
MPTVAQLEGDSAHDEKIDLREIDGISLRAFSSGPSTLRNLQHRRVFRSSASSLERRRTCPMLGLIQHDKAGIGKIRQGQVNNLFVGGKSSSALNLALHSVPIPHLYGYLCSMGSRLRDDL